MWPISDPTVTSIPSSTYILDTEPDCPADFELVGGECVHWLGYESKFEFAQELCELVHPDANVLMLKTEQLSTAILNWDKVTQK